MQNELLQEAELRRLAVRTGRAGRHVERHHPQLAEARLDVASFGVEFAHREALPYLIGRLAAVERDTAVALLLGEGVAALERLQAVQLRVEVGLVAFDFLQADYVGAVRGEPAEQALLRRRPDAVDVEGDDFQEDGKLEAPPCAADHLAGSCRNFSPSAPLPASR